MDTGKTSRSPHTWTAKLTVSEVPHVGTVEDCEAWAESLKGREAFIVDDKGVAHVIGIVTRCEMKAIV